MRTLMPRLICSLAAAFILVTAVQAQALPKLTQTQTVPTAPTIKLTMEDQHVLKEILLKTAKSDGSAEKSEIERGKQIPASVQLKPFPDDIASKIPSIKAHQYFLADNAIVIVEPQKRTVVEVVK